MGGIRRKVRKVKGMEEQFIIFITSDKCEPTTNNGKEKVDEPEADINKSFTKTVRNLNWTSSLAL